MLDGFPIEKLPVSSEVVVEKPFGFILCVGHSRAEEVELSAYVSSGSGVVRVASTDFHYEDDAAHQMATFLLGSVDNLKDLGNCGERHHLAPHDQADLDERLTAAFNTFQLPQCWSMMGTDLRGTEAAERLLHFSARLGLTQLSTHFLTLPGSQVALSSQNHERLLPEELAFKKGFHDLGQLLQYYRKQSTVFHPYKAALEQKEKVHPLVITTDIKQNSREIEHDIYELVKKLALSDLESDDCDSESMKELNTTKNGNLFQDLTTKLKDVHMFNTSNRSASLPRQAFRNQAPRYQARVLEFLGKISASDSTSLTAALKYCYLILLEMEWLTNRTKLQPTVQSDFH
ncbi:uncharacterized protein TNIN_112691 [Trichonephila inaurata madagascariensis]|uniref:Uncharacterized protein n=1 Tax=Trichonephila inaurata madagascariensis TaxID=2747483 RepID=A0A8X6K487_9ARAC|nr:uncharacterized protein TNIN_112691 [Trichonephila inaurata madagascariensis]